MKTNIQTSPRLARIFFISVAVILLLLSFTLFRQVRDLIESYEGINKANIVTLRLEQTVSSLKEAESAQRGFLLTKDSAFLHPYKGAYARCKNLLLQLQDLITNSAIQQHNLNELTTLIEVRFRTFASLISHYNNPGINEGTRKSHLVRGNAAMARIQYYIDQISNYEKILLQAKEKRRYRLSYLAPIWAFILIITAIGILIFFYHRTIKQLHKTRRLLGALRNLNERLKQNNYQLNLHNKELESFIWITSHDLKEPLRKGITFSSLVEESEEKSLSDSNKKNLGIVVNSLFKMQTLLDGLMFYYNSTILLGKMELVDINKCLLEAEQSLKEEIKTAEAVILKDKLPFIKGYHRQITQLFVSLITNALQYKKNELAPLLSIECSTIKSKNIKHRFYKRTEEYYQILIRDNGLGFNNMYSEKVFGIFQKIHNESRSGGPGIGLTICKKIMQNHNGFIAAKSAVDEGTAFELYFPVEATSNHSTK